jgi:hypothetical protein
MSGKIKIKVRVRKPRIEVPFSEIEDGFTNANTLRNMRSFLTVLNRHLDLDLNIIHVTEYEDNLDKIVSWIKSHYAIFTNSDMRIKILMVSSLITRCTPKSDKPNKFKAYAAQIEQYAPIESVPKERKEIPKWETEVMADLDRIISSRNKVCQILATCFKHGYVMRINQLFSTALYDRDGFDWIDLKGKMWHIRDQKNDDVWSFPITDEFQKDISALVGRNKAFLIEKSTGTPYAQGKQRLSLHKWKSIGNTELRQSYEEWNIYRSGRTVAEQAFWHRVLGHTRTAVLRWYVVGANPEGEAEADDASGYSVHSM